MTDRCSNQVREFESIRKNYEDYSVPGFYEKFGDRYYNPHESTIHQSIQLAVRQWHLNLDKVLDLACGSGEVTVALNRLGYDNIDAIDPYTDKAYFNRTGKLAETYCFEEIGSGVLNGRDYSIIICSFALHLLSESRLPLIAYQLSAIANSLLIITPHKRPHLKPEWGWNLQAEMIVERVRSRLYSSIVKFSRV